MKISNVLSWYLESMHWYFSLFGEFHYSSRLNIMFRKGKVKVKFSLCLTKYNAMKTYWGSALDGGEWSASWSGRFTSRERALFTNWIRSWVGPGAVLDAVVKRKVPSSCQESNPSCPARSLVAIPTELSRFLENKALLTVIVKPSL
jgi:hypothetical protein